MTPNFNGKQIISKEELTAWDESLRELLGNVLFYNRNTAQVGGILDAYDTDTLTYINDFFSVSVGSIPSSGFNTLKIGIGRGVLDVKNTTTEEISGLVTNNNSLKNSLVSLFKWAETDNIVIDGISGYTSGNVIYFGFIPVWNPLEAGLCSITSANQVSISGGDFDKVRGQSTKNPTKVRFYQENGSPASNDDIYEVISVDHTANTLIISGAVNTEGNLKMMIVGSYDLSAQGSLTDVFAYVKAEGKLTFSATASDITGVGGFIIGSLTFGSAGAFTINDLRSANLFQFAYSPDIVYKSLDQTITGQKTFTTKSPEFGIPVVDIPNTATFASPLLLNTVSGNLKTITIPTTEGSVFMIKANSISNLNILKYIKFAGTLEAGKRFYLLIDPTGSDLIIEASTDQYGILSYDNFGALSGLTITRGNTLEFWADSNLIWHLHNVVSQAFSTISLAKGSFLASGAEHITDPAIATVITIPIGSTLPTISYQVFLTVVSRSLSGGSPNPGNDDLVAHGVKNTLTYTSFGVSFLEFTSNVQDVDLEWIIFAK